MQRTGDFCDWQLERNGLTDSTRAHSIEKGRHVRYEAPLAAPPVGLGRALGAQTKVKVKMKQMKTKSSSSEW